MIDLNKLEKYRENNRIEAKKAIGGLPHSIWETYSAFANTLGGLILLGVEELEDKALHPIELPFPEELVDEFWSLINSEAKVSRNILTKDDVTIQTSGERKIVVINVPRAHRIDRPVYIDGDLYSGTYRRNGEGDYRCTHEEIEAMLRDASERAADMQVLDLMDLSVFDENSISSYRIRCKYEGTEDLSALDDMSFLKEIGAAAQDENGVMHPTAAGLLMFGYEYEIVRQFPLYHLEYKEENDNGTLYTISSDSGDWSGNVYDFFQKVNSRIIEDMRFITDEAYENSIRSAVREALANCLINADYYGSHGLQVIRRNSGIVLSNPGGLRIEPDKAKVKGISDPRNKGLINMFRLMGAGKGKGAGLRDIYSLWQSGGFDEPTLTEEFGEDRTTLSLPVKTRTERVRINDKQREMLAEYLTDNVTADAESLSEILGGDMLRTSQLLRQLVWEKLIVAEDMEGRTFYRLRHEHK